MRWNEANFLFTQKKIKTINEIYCFYNEQKIIFNTISINIVKSYKTLNATTRF